MKLFLRDFLKMAALAFVSGGSRIAAVFFKVTEQCTTFFQIDRRHFFISGCFRNVQDRAARFVMCIFNGTPNDFLQLSNANCSDMWSQFFWIKQTGMFARFAKPRIILGKFRFSHALQIEYCTSNKEQSSHVNVSQTRRATIFERKKRLPLPKAALNHDT